MNKLYKPVIVKKVIDDEHFYYVNKRFRPSVTHILGATLPTPQALKIWLGDMGNEKAQEKMERAGEIGTLIHDACERLILGQEINLLTEFPNRTQKKMLVGFINWFVDYSPKIIKGTTPELILASRRGFAGTCDLPVVLGTTGKSTIVDIKTTSAGLYDSHKLQLAAYQGAFKEMFGFDVEIGVLHLTAKAKRGYVYYDQSKMMIKGKTVTIYDFNAVLRLYKVLHGGKIPQPPEMDEYPEKIKLDLIKNHSNNQDD